MTWAKTSVGRTISRTGVFLKRQIWIWPILAVVLLSVIGLFVRRAIETTMRDGLQSELQTLRRLGSRDARDLVPCAEVERRVAGQQPRHSPNDLSAAGDSRRCERETAADSVDDAARQARQVAWPGADGAPLCRLPRGRQEEADRRLRPAGIDRPAGHSGIRRVPDRALGRRRRTSRRRFPAWWR